MEENNDHEEFEEAPVKPLWEVTYWDNVAESVKQIHVFACCHWCLLDQMEGYLDKKIGESNWTVMKMEQMINVNIINIEFAQYDEDDEDDCEINPGIEEGDQGDGFYSAK